MNLISRRQQFTAPAADILVIHSSDIHVSEGFTEPVHAGDGTAGLRVVLAAAHANHAHVVILAGDTFENNRLSSALLERTHALLATAGMPVVMLPGNHDPAIAESVFRRGGFDRLPQVHVLGVTHEDAILFPSLGLEIWGNPHRDYHDMAPLLRRRERRSFWQIAAAHGHYEPKPNRATQPRASWLIGDDDIDGTEADYVALGHWNRHAPVGSGRVAAYYSGSPDYAGTVNLVRLKRGGEVEVTREPVSWDA